MKIRSRLVSNSSSTSFTAIGFQLKTSDYGEKITDQEKALASFILGKDWAEGAEGDDQDVSDYLHDKLNDMTGAKIPGTPDHKLAFGYVEGSGIDGYITGVEVFSSFEESFNIISFGKLDDMVETAKKIANLCGFSGELKIYGGTIYC